MESPTIMIRGRVTLLGKGDGMGSVGDTTGSIEAVAGGARDGVGVMVGAGVMLGAGPVGAAGVVATGDKASLGDVGLVGVVVDWAPGPVTVGALGVEPPMGVDGVGATVGCGKSVL